mmetsp:Transcript_15399/g.32580  ORF Transcript_15399/g.32580 Transcript_15399/m.32580 type:complete len:313 (-) Transcript_15399:93-1031(-)|eukprot:CAMPEP_0183735344 /NCGR_PEP_ID=MMETSP0737-20130205/46369_1 /TAXON_ID=385413 /ORGANISM="Thalassiosira miniscula, Strain CCMP1093" /LENGTH=312 /DNA_ID=CAMNT_0025969063 /DNA_START=132 /DNA_END=1070 /DNA_ORIENTATION=+
MKQMKRRMNRKTALLLSITLLAHTTIHPTIAHAARFNININSKQQTKRTAAIEELKRLIPPPSPRDLGGEEADDEAYARFLSVSEWDPVKAAPKLNESFQWRKKVRPGQLRPRHCNELCRQYAWVALTSGSSKMMLLEEDNDTNNNNSPNNSRTNNEPLPLDIPHNCPPLQSWKTTRHGLPITYFRCWKWRPDKASSDEMERHMAYHMHHLVRRTRGGVSRVCIIFDMRGFEGWMLPYIHQGVNVLRQHYPGRAGAMCFINVPGYFNTVWKIISPWLDDEIRSKTFFAPKEVDDVDKGIGYLNKMNLKCGPV